MLPVELVEASCRQPWARTAQAFQELKKAETAYSQPYALMLTSIGQLNR